MVNFIKEYNFIREYKEEGGIRRPKQGEGRANLGCKMTAANATDEV